MVVVAYVRHGKRDSTPETIFRDGSPGTIPCSLLPEGVEQARAAGVQLSEFQLGRMVSSPLLRAFYTADLIRYEYFTRSNRHLNIEFDRLLIERQVGALNNGPVPGGVPYVEFRDAQARAGYPDVENFEVIKGRISSFVVKMETTNAVPGLIVASTHQDTVHAALGHALHTDELDTLFNPGVKEGSLTIISYSPAWEGGRTVVISAGESELSKEQIRDVKKMLRNN